ncbi:MAG: hypothetical protein CMK89_14285 [Pseudomonadales bacterium]|nr:hypothetical protein [Pseudomonadales bacterium]
MKFVIKLIMFLVVFGLAGPYLLMGPDGMQKLMQIKDSLPSLVSISAPSLEDAGDLLSGGEGLGEGGEQWIQWSEEHSTFQQPDQLTREQLAVLDIQRQKNIYYRWQDDNGVWQFSELPNRNTLNMVVRTDPDANVLQGLSEDQIDAAFGRVKNTNSIVENNPFANGEGLDQTLPIPTTIPIAEIPDLIEQAKDVQRIMDERMKQMDIVLGAPSE